MARLVFNINASPYIHSLNQIYSPKSIRCFGRYCAYHWVKNAFSGPSTVSAQNHPSTARTYIWCGCSSCCGPTGLLVVYVCVCGLELGVSPATPNDYEDTHIHKHTYTVAANHRAHHTQYQFCGVARASEQENRGFAIIVQQLQNVYTSLFARNKTSGRAYKRKKKSQLERKIPWRLLRSPTHKRWGPGRWRPTLLVCSTDCCCEMLLSRETISPL